MVGNDGVVGGLAALDGKVSLSRGIVQLSGAAMVCDPRRSSRSPCKVPQFCRC
jgi:hypothetical protein